MDFPFPGKRVGYALSFGCVSYPEDALREARKHIESFDALSVRETSGIEIVRSMVREDSILVPDPTLLMESSFYHTLADECSILKIPSYTFCFFIRHIAERKKEIKTKLKDWKTLWNNDNGHYSLHAWLSKIKYAEFIVTDSYHCAVMCLKLHKPFAVVTELEGKVGMNDRVYTLLSKMGIERCIVYKGRIEVLNELRCVNYDWDEIDNELNEMSKIGINFLKTI